MSLVDQIFEQAKLGTAVNPDSNPFAEGMRIGQGQQRINLEKQQLAMQIAQLPLQKTLMQQKTDLGQAHLTQYLQDQQTKIEGEKAFAELQELVSPSLATGNLEDATLKSATYALDHPVIFDTDRYKAFSKQLDEMQKEANWAKYRMAAIRVAQEKADKLPDKTAPVVPVVPNVQIFDGQKFLVNPKTGHMERLDKGITKQAFVAKQIGTFMKDNMIDERDAADRLGKLYDEQIAPMGNTTTGVKEKATGSDEGKVYVRKDGQLYRLPKAQLEEAKRQGYVPE